jgi:hypothetical protein
MTIRVHVYIDGDIAFTIGLDEQGFLLLPSVGDALEYKDKKYPVNERVFYYETHDHNEDKNGEQIINLVCGEELKN